MRIAIGFIPAPVIFKPHLRRHPRAADIEARLGRIMPRVRRPELPVFQNFRVQLDHINTMMPRRFLRMLLPMLRCEKLAGGDDDITPANDITAFGLFYRKNVNDN